MAAGLSVDLESWRRKFDELMLRVGGRFARVEPRRRMAAFVRGLLAGLPRVNCWSIAVHAGERCPRGMQRLLSEAAWDEAGMRDDLRGYVLEHFADPAAVLVIDELGPVIPRTFLPVPGWSPDGHRVKAPLEYSRGPEKTWVYGGLRVADGQAVTMCAPSRNSAFYQDFLQLTEQANPEGTIWVVTDNLSSHDSKSTRAWLEGHPRIRHAFIPTRACWLNLQEGWWRIFRRQALAGQDFADPGEIACATRVATAQLNARARPWIWGRPQPKPRSYRRRFIYTL